MTLWSRNASAWSYPGHSMSSRISATTTRDRLPVAVSEAAALDRLLQQDERVARYREPAISSALRSLAIRIAAATADGSCRSARKLSKVSSVQAGSTPSSHRRTCGSCRKSSATMAQPAMPNCRKTGGFGRSHSLSFDQRRRPETFRTAMRRPSSVRPDDQPLAARDAGIKQVPLQHGVMLSEHRDDHGGIFRALTFVDGRRIGRHQHVEFPKSVSDGPTIKARNDLACIGVDIVDIADIAIVDLLVVILLDLHDLVTRRKGPMQSNEVSLSPRRMCPPAQLTSYCASDGRRGPAIYRPTSGWLPQC